MQSLTIDPNFTEALMAKGVALQNMRRYDEAVTAYDKALETNPRDAGAWYVKGMTLKNMGRYEEAAECNKMASALDPRYVYQVVFYRDFVVDPDRQTPIDPLYDFIFTEGTMRQGIRSLVGSSSPSYRDLLIPIVWPA